MKKELVRVQCISNKSGFHERLEIGKWYEAEEYYNRRNGLVEDYIIYGLGKITHPLDSESGVYEKSLFRTVDERRDDRLNKLGI